MTTHHFDSAGVCLYCDRCSDPACCDAPKCDRRNLLEFNRMRVEAMQRTLGRCDCGGPMNRASDGYLECSRCGMAQ